MTDCNSTKDAIIEKFGTKDTKSVEHKTSRGVTGIFIFDIDIPGIGPCGLVMDAEKDVSRFKADIKLSRLDGDTVFFTIYTK